MCRLKLEVKLMESNVMWLPIRVPVEEKKVERYVGAESRETYTVTLGNSDSVCEVMHVRHLAHRTGCTVSAQCV